MRILCDQNVAHKYRLVLERGSWLNVSTVATELSPRASDSTISEFASTDGWVLFTSDDDFHVDNRSHGLLVYSQVEDPPPGTVVRAIEAIAEAYAHDDEVDKYVPSGWV